MTEQTTQTTPSSQTTPGARRSGGHLLVAQLEAMGVERVYGVPGESYLDVLDGLHDSSIRTIVCRHEGGAGFMALAEGRLTGRPGVAMVTRGPGAANAFIAIHTAWQDATPMVLFVGLIPVADRDRESFQEFDLRAWFGSTAKRVMILDDPGRAAEYVRDAFHLASSGRPGPVVIGLPEDVIRRETANDVVAPRALPLAKPHPEELAELDGLLAKAERPLLVAGGDCWDEASAAALAAWAESHAVPVACDWRAYDAISHDSPAYVGWLGYGRASTLVDAYREADLLVFVGCARTDVASEGYKAGLETPTVVVGADPDLEAHAGRLDLHIHATPAGFAASLDALDGRRGADDARVRELRDAELRYREPRPDGGEHVDLGAAMPAVRDLLPEDAILCYGAGNATIWGHRYLPHRRARSVVGPRNGAMGLSVPAAVAASLCYPERLAVAICGDGDFLMNAQELAVATRYGASPLVFVVDNGIYGTIVEHQRREYPGRPSGTGMTNPDFGAWMRSFGGFGERIEATGDVAGAVERALAFDGPRLIHLVTDPATMSPSTDNSAAPAADPA
ncbi:Acetolactate synthase isozyme 2 large subunit [Pseudoclavibacter triregionum]|nr:Acetolactate synthase isozyme 2 large subunit [Pseudoclavibacter triregionum]